MIVAMQECTGKNVSFQRSAAAWKNLRRGCQGRSTCLKPWKILFRLCPFSRCLVETHSTSAVGKSWRGGARKVCTLGSRTCCCELTNSPHGAMNLNSRRNVVSWSIQPMHSIRRLLCRCVTAIFLYLFFFLFIFVCFPSLISLSTLCLHQIDINIIITRTYFARAHAIQVTARQPISPLTT